MLVFAGGMGEDALRVRARTCEELSFLGIELDDSRNAETAGVIPGHAAPQPHVRSPACLIWQ